jgi:hypothetical protein
MATTQSDNAIVEQLMFLFAKGCDYVLNQSFERRLRPNARKAAEVCKELKVDPATYVDAHIMYSPILRGYTNLTPEQLCTSKSMIYVKDFIAGKGDRNIAMEFETECKMLAQYIDNGWVERLALLNPTFDFSPYFRILISKDRDEEIIKQYSNQARQILANDKELVAYLKTVKSADGIVLDLSRIKV